MEQYDEARRIGPFGSWMRKRKREASAYGRSKTPRYTGPCYVDLLPDEILLHVMSFLPHTCAERFGRIGSTCRRWHALVRDGDQADDGGPCRDLDHVFRRDHAACLTPRMFTHWSFAKGNVRDRVYSAIQAGAARCLDSICDRTGYMPGTSECAQAAMANRFAVLKRLRARGCEWDAWTCACIADRGTLEVLQWARQNGCPWDARTCDFAAHRNHYPMLRWARENGCGWSGDSVLRHVAKYGDAEMLQWTYDQGGKLDTWAAAEAAQYGNMAALEWMHAKACRMDEWACLRAAEYCRLDALKWLRARGCPWNRAECLAVKRPWGWGDPKETIEWIRSQDETGGVRPLL